MIGLYFYGLTSVSKNDNVISFTVLESSGKKDVINDLYEQKLIKSRFASMLYVYLHKDIVVQPGTYNLSQNMDVAKIFEVLKTGGDYRITFVEGKRLPDYIKQISEKFAYSEEEVIKVLNDKDFLKELINEYYFLDESILNNEIYYSLEGYIYPSTYNFSENDSIKDIIKKTLDKTKEILDNYITLVEKSGYSYHEILTIASIIESETKYAEDKDIVSQVIYKRLNLGMNLGMDVTSYYGVRKSFQEELTNEDLLDQNPYNTRLESFIGLPVGPICNPSRESIEAALNPSDTEYVYFYADLDGKLHFAKTYEEHKVNKETYGW